VPPIAPIPRASGEAWSQEKVSSNIVYATSKSSLANHGSSRAVNSAKVDSGSLVPTHQAAREQRQIHAPSMDPSVVVSPPEWNLALPLVGASSCHVSRIPEAIGSGIVACPVGADSKSVGSQQSANRVASVSCHCRHPVVKICNGWRRRRRRRGRLGLVDWWCGMLRRGWGRTAGGNGWGGEISRY